MGETARATHDDARYAAALAEVERRIAALEATLVRARAVVAEAASRSRCPECLRTFTPTDPRQYLCGAGCVAQRHARSMRLLRARRRRTNPLGVSVRVPRAAGTCACGAALCFDTGEFGASLESCSDPRCPAHAWRPTSRRAA